MNRNTKKKLKCTIFFEDGHDGTPHLGLSVPLLMPLLSHCHVVVLWWSGVSDSDVNIALSKVGGLKIEDFFKPPGLTPLPPTLGSQNNSLVPPWQGGRNPPLCQFMCVW